MTGLQVAGGILPALGFAITISVIGKKGILPYFVLGFFLFQYAQQVNTIAFALLGIFMAFLHITFTKSNSSEEAGIL
jgi:mannose/fructose/N-acetylgalactosamine-specific phosphotransferase system component IIC